MAEYATPPFFFHDLIAAERAAERKTEMDKWMRRKLDYLRAQLQKQELQLAVAKDSGDNEAVARLERQVETTKSDMVRVIGA
jgi:hypothetical protein